MQKLAAESLLLKLKAPLLHGRHAPQATEPFGPLHTPRLPKNVFSALEQPEPVASTSSVRSPVGKIVTKPSST